MFSEHLKRCVPGILCAALVALPLLVIPPAPAFADTDNAGNVIAARRDAWAERGRQKPQLYSKSPVFTGDRLSTNPVGRLQVLFNDDSVLMLAPDSQATISEYVYSEGAGASGNSFNISLAKGVTNLISGRMVENEPGSMRVETPEITVGIQGTALAVQTGGGISKVMIAHATPGKPTLVICGEDQRKTELHESGMVLIMNAEAQCVPEIRRMTAEEQFFLRSLSLPLSGPGISSAAAPTAPLPAAPAQHVTLLAQAPLVDLKDLMQPPLDNPVSQDFAGYYAGSLSGTYLGEQMSGEFGMGVANLTTGPTIEAINMWAGTMSEEGFGYDNFAGIGIDSNGNFSFTDDNPSNLYVGTISMPSSPQLSVSGGIVGDSIGLNWSVQDQAPSGFEGMSGSGEGGRAEPPG